MALDPRYPSPPARPGLIYVPDRLTPMTLLEAACAYDAAVKHVCGEELSRDALAAVVGQSAFESGWWKFNHLDNFTNMKIGNGWQGSFTDFRCNEVINGKIEWFDPHHPQTWFRAFISADKNPQKSHQIGAEAAVRFIATATRSSSKPNRYARAWDAARAGDADGYALELGVAGFYTADRAAYRRGVIGCARRVKLELPSVLPVIPHVHDPIVLLPTAGHSKFSDHDLEERIEHLQIPLDWVEDWRAGRDAAVRDG